MVFTCSQCEYKVENAIELKFQVIKVHSPKSKVLCKFCLKPFASRQSFCTHIIKKENNFERRKENTYSNTLRFQQRAKRRNKKFK